MQPSLTTPHHSVGQRLVGIVHEVAVTGVAVVGLLDITDAFLVPRMLDFRAALIELASTQAPQAVLVTDTQGRVVPDITVLLESEDGPTPLVLLTNTRGFATIPFLASGSYRIRLAGEDAVPSPPFTIGNGESDIIAVTVAARTHRAARVQPARARPPRMGLIPPIAQITGLRSGDSRMRTPAARRKP